MLYDVMLSELKTPHLDRAGAIAPSCLTPSESELIVTLYRDRFHIINSQVFSWSFSFLQLPFVHWFSWSVLKVSGDNEI